MFIALKITFWLFLFVVIYAYIGYGILLFILIKLKRLLSGDKDILVKVNDYMPDVTLFVTAFNEKDFVSMKIKNSYELDYPKEKIKFIWITDGSNDGTPDLLKKYPEVSVYHEDARRGKIMAMNRGLQFVKTPITIFSDANTLLGKDSVNRIVALFANPKTGCVSGEKRIMTSEAESAAGAGEGIYWKYESKLKQWDSELYSVVGAAGELFAVRTELMHEVEPDTLLDDFIISLRIAMKGYTIQYDPEAYAMETSSANVKEELKRKIRIAAGGIQSVVRLRALLNIFKYRTLSFQYISHRVLRWTLAPLGLLLIFLSNFALAIHAGILSLSFYPVLFGLQMLFYISALTGWYLQSKRIKVKALFVPYYFFIMNYAVYLGFLRYIKGKQSVNWERAKRAS